MIKRCLFLFLIFCLSGTVLAQSKGGRWLFDNNAGDSASWDMTVDNGSLMGSATYSQDTPLQQGTSYLWLDSIYNDNYVKIEDSDDLDFTDENIGLSAWIYPIKLSEAHFFINKGFQDTNPKTTNYSLRVSKSSALEFLIRDSENRAQNVASSFKIPLNQWTFVAVFYDFEAQTVYMWNDPSADPVDTLEFNQSFFANDGPLGIGAWNNTDENNPVAAFKGRIDDVRISGRKEDVLPSELTALKYKNKNMLTAFNLAQNYPNPFNPRTMISFDLPQPGFVTLKIYDSRGRHTDTLVEKQLVAGTYEYHWDGRQYASGVYFYQVKSAGFIQTKKMLLIK